MAHWGGVAMLALTGIAILGAWLWLWAGFTRRMRVIAVERLYPWAPGAVIPSIQALVWPALPLVGLAWIAVGAMAVPIASGHSALSPVLVVVVLFGAVCALAILVALGKRLPRYCYPGWRAVRYYRAHPDVARQELDARTLRHIARV